MATKDNNEGLLSKVVRFVRNPTTDWAELDNPDSVPDTGYSKQALKEMIERKRKNDFVRRREFDQLRKIRSREPVSINPEHADRPSFFQTSSVSNPEDRSSTLKKIDDIEAQMSKQWWKGRKDESEMPKDGMAPTLAPLSEDEASDEMNFQVTRGSELHLSDAGETDFAATVRGSAHGDLQGMFSRDPSDRGAPSEGSQVVAQEWLGDVAVDPDIEEAAIRFANGDDAGAEVGLLTALDRTELDQNSVNTWAAALFDFYRATGQKARFDKVADDLELRFGCRAPVWFSVPELLGRLPQAEDDWTMPAALEGGPIWECPAELTLDAVDRLNLILANAQMPWCLSWRNLTTIAANVAEPLGKVVSQWCTAPLQLQFLGAGTLETSLRLQTPSGDKQVSQAMWRLRLDMLRVMELQDEFELAALDYCVTFEVSPPSWQDSHCQYIQEKPRSSSDATDHGVFSPGEHPPRWQSERAGAQTVPMGPDAASQVATVALSGEIMGDATEEIAGLDMAIQGNQRLAVSCAHLVRIDFSAVCSLLNLAASHHDAGCQVQFLEVHRLVAAFFSVVGIHEHARVFLRSN